MHIWAPQIANILLRRNKIQWIVKVLVDNFANIFNFEVILYHFLQPLHDGMTKHPDTGHFLYIFVGIDLYKSLSQNVILQYRTWENFGGGKSWRIWRTVGNSPKFSPPIFINARIFNIHYPQIRQFFPRQRP